MKHVKRPQRRRSDEETEDCKNEFLGFGIYTGEMEVRRTAAERKKVRRLGPIGFVHFTDK